MEELKARSFRISEEVSAKLKELCENFDNQNSALSALINAYEVQNAKTTLIDRQTDISDYDTHIQAIQSAFLRSLEINENAEKRIKTEFINLLNSKDQTIVQLQTEKAQADEQVEKYKSAYGNREIQVSIRQSDYFHRRKDKNYADTSIRKRKNLAERERKSQHRAESKRTG